MLLKYLILVFILSFSTSFSQEFISIHKRDYKLYKSNVLQKSFFDSTGKDIIPLIPKKNALKKAVFGYLPDWEYQNARNYLKYELLSHIALFDFPVDSLGVIKNPAYWPWSDVINAAHQKGTKAILTIVNFEGSQINQILRISSAKQNFFSNLKSKIQQYQLDGVNIDFEEVYSSDRGDVLNGFMKDLTDSLHKVNPNWDVSFAGPAVSYSGWKLSGLASACDYIFIMGYAFYGSWSSTTGPSSPLNGGTYNISNTINVQYSSVIQSMPHKLILGVPYYGEKWIAKTSDPHSKVTKYVSSTRFKDDAGNSQAYGLLWATDNNTPWYRWKITDTSWYQVWFDNDSSLGLKYSLAESKNLKGVGMWALGYDGARLELWNELKKRYFVTDIKNEETELPSEFVLYQNYPNPFNSSTKIIYELPITTKVTIKVYDMLGSEIDVLVDEEKSEGIYEVSFDSKNLSSGIYYYKMNAWIYSKTKKLVILK